MGAEVQHTLPPNQVSGLVLAGGEGLRISEGPKAFLKLEGRTLLERVIALIAPLAGELIVGLPSDRLQTAKDYAGRRPFQTVAGGKTRQETAGILVRLATRPFVLIQDVARPLTHRSHIEAALELVRTHGAVVTVRPATRRDGVALREGDFYGRSLPREAVILTQTPQVYRRDILLEAFRQAEAKGWQEISPASLVAMAGYRVRLLESPTENLKITYPGDLEKAQAQLMKGPAENR